MHSHCSNVPVKRAGRQYVSILLAIELWESIHVATPSSVGGKKTNIVTMDGCIPSLACHATIIARQRALVANT